jgi:copper transport protein
VDNKDFKITAQNDMEATVSLDSNLIKDGVYSVSWLTLSLDDGHVAKGTYVVGVGNFTDSQTVPKNASQQKDLFTPILAIIKAPIIIGEVCILGFVFSQLYLWKDLNRIGLGSAIHLLSKAKMRTLITTSSIVMIALSTSYFLFQAAVLTENDSSYFDYLSMLFFDTNNGIVWLLRIICCVTLLSLVHFYSKIAPKNSGDISTSYTRSTIVLWILLLTIGIFIAVNSSISHSSSVESWSQIGIFTDFVHTVVVSIWIGGLTYISYVFFPNITYVTKIISDNVQAVSIQQISVELLMLARFSILATISIAIISITGLFLAWLHILTIDELLVSDYGRTLIVKLSIALLVIIFGGYHQFWINRIFNLCYVERNYGEKPNIKKPRFKLPASVKSTIKIEAILMLFILAAASLLTVTSPPSQDHQMIHAGTSDNQVSSDMNSNFVQTLEIQGVPISIHISPFVVGFNNFTVNFLGENQNVTKVSNVFIEFKKADLSLSAINAKLESSNDTAYSTFGGYLSQPGEWDLKITVQRSGSYDLNYRLGLIVNKLTTDQEHHDLSQTISTDPETSDTTSDFTLSVTLLSIFVAALSALFSINALKRLTAIQKELGLQK